MTLILIFTGRQCVIGRFGELTKLAFLVSIVSVFFVSCAGGFKDISTPGRELHAENDSLVRKFAPLLKFDRAAASYSYPMDAQEFYEKWKKYGKGYFKVENTDKKTLTSKKNPTYYQLRIFGNTWCQL
jgi:hypothetical protein